MFALCVSERWKKVALLLIVVNLFLLGVWIFGEQPSGTSNISGVLYADELDALSKSDQSFQGLVAYFTDLADAKGAVRAFDVLKIAPLPPNIDLHLLGHVVGDELYKQEGIDGMRYCTHDFRNACSHSVVIGALLENGQGVFDDIHVACEDAPGGSGAYTMCFHGFGHGVLAFTDYDVPEAVDLCKKVGTEEHNNREFVECVGGVVMEMISGIHNRATWERKKEVYFDEGDPLHLCNDYIKYDEAKNICYTYITPKLFEAAGMNLGRPNPETFQEAFSFCDSLDSDSNRLACYGGFGKEFVVLAQNRDIRKIEDTSEAQLRTIRDWCYKAKDSDGIRVCLMSALDSLYWGGENVADVSVNFCNILGGSEYGTACFHELIRAVSIYIQDTQYRSDFCDSVPKNIASYCSYTLL